MAGLYAVRTNQERAPDATGAYNLLIGVFNVALELFFLIAPIPVIMSFNLSLRKRIGVGAVFMAGLM